MSTHAHAQAQAQTPTPTPTKEPSTAAAAAAATTSPDSAPLRQLLPAHPPDSDSARRRASPAASTKEGPRKSYVLAACEACRRRKSKCSGERPVCLVCSRRGSKCHYTTSVSETRGQALKRRYNQLNTADSPHRNLVELLKSISDEQALSIVRRLRAGDQPELVLGQLSAGSALVQLAVTPETRFRYVFPLLAEMPRGLARDNPYLDSILYEAASLFDRSPRQPGSSPPSMQLARIHDRPELQSLYDKPYHAAEAIVPRLCSVTPSAWTTVCRDDILMRKLLANYFANDYNCAASFHIDFFLEDMITGRTDFCSSLLVNAVLAHACSTFMPFPDRSEYWNPDTLSYKFLVEAKRLWEIKAHPAYIFYDSNGRITGPHLTTIQAGIEINVTINLSCMDRIGKTYGDRALQMAHAVDLFNYNNTCLNPRATDRFTIGKAFTAWSFYNWESLLCYHFFRVPESKEPPRWPLPDLIDEPRWYGDVALKYPGATSLSPTYLGYWLRARCEFRVIMNEFAQTFYDERFPMTKQNILADPERALRISNSFHARLKEWYHALPSFLSAKEIALPAHIQLHCYYQNMLISLYDHLQDIPTELHPRPRAIVSEAKRHFVTLIRLYYLRHGFESTDTWIGSPLVWLAGSYNTMLKEGNMSGVELLEAQSTLILLLKGLRDQSQNNAVCELLFRVTRAAMRAEEQSLLVSEGVVNSEEEERKKTEMHAVQMSWPAMATTMADDPHSQSMTQIANGLNRVKLASRETTSSP